ncbi:MAG: amino acid carrier protein [Chlamydiales bacterium]|nr:amino acid carrier protein [Chlamydiales bacterium]
MESLFQILDSVNNILWSEYVSIPLILLLGIFFTIKSGFLQIRSFHRVIRNFTKYFFETESSGKGIHPLKVFFAAVGGCVGVGNIVGICEAVKFGGPGALFWIWVTGLLGMIIKYSEVFLGMKFRVENDEGGYDGGPMYYLKNAYSSNFLKKWVPRVVCIFLCIYGVEIYLFSVISTTIVDNWGINRELVVTGLLIIVMLTVKGGMQRVGNVCGTIIPIFILIFSGMSLWVIFQNIGMLPEVFSEVLSSAFTGHAAVGGFAGATIAQTVSWGIKRSCYSGDVGIGYTSVVHTESKEQDPRKQASLAIFGIFLDTFVVCTLSVVVVLFTQVWKEPIEATFFVQKSLEMYFYGVKYFWPFFIFILGYSTIITFFAMGMKSADFLLGHKGRTAYYYLAGVMFVVFAFFDSSKALLVMEVSGGCLLLINLTGFYLLRKEIVFKVPRNFS